jgi:hypothetical protein
LASAAADAACSVKPVSAAAMASLERGIGWVFYSGVSILVAFDMKLTGRPKSVSRSIANVFLTLRV